MFALASRGEGGAASFIDDDVILRRRLQTALPPKDLATPELFLRRRGASTKRFDVHNRKTKVKSSCFHF